MMTTDDLLKIVKKALQTKREVTLEDSVDTLEEWDSLGQLAILVGIDKKLGGKAAEIKQLTACHSIQSLAEILREHHLLS